VRLLDAEVIEHADAVAGHVGERVGRAAVTLEQLQQARRGLVLEMRRAADVAVVVADHVEPALGQLPAEVVVVGDHLGAEAHDQQHRRVPGIAEGLEADLDVAHAGKRLGHGGRA
jgi:hypothetical protein